MPARSLTLDHLVIAARTLDEGVRHVADALGIEPAGGGRHPLMRTHNALFGAWGGLYLEVIAIDPDAPAADHTAPPRARLFALDDPAMHARLADGPFLAHWVARVERPRQLALWHKQYPARIAPVVAMQRGDLTWRLTVPDDGAFPAWQGAGDGVVPSLIQWDTARHPADALPHGGIALKALRATHPRADLIREQLDWLGADHLLEVDPHDGPPALVAEFETPAGIRTLR
ncbi:VOC family protein [Burkholderia dolosa]|uniref:VOC family protein n=1 Tax=Burkholderia dolosa TaxID=152500 RepID=A0A892I743_9BURK|nr:MULTISPECIES: VOC family protein [Burkholderia]AKE03066.1 glyoxalase [Burkholderia cepacia]AJY12463.1 glyoxalase-like domain protein [Burkholderia dolosa AU0158]AYZ97823.1 VOC family protein [Burkholderia dolosa]ETP64890.1 glyoxalase [Burkholderia dolosa PC543]MBR8419773.1 VOC family protein [Burkholderia dolosa]